MKKTSYVFFNEHPDGKRVGDCVKRSLTTVQDITYQEVAKELNRLKRELGEKQFSSDKVWKEYIKRKEWEKLSFPASKGKPRMNGEQFATEHPTGTYILNMAHHLTACVDGVIYDTWDCRLKCVYNAFKVK